MTTGDPRINLLAERAEAWLARATPAELWGAMEHNDIDARCGMPGLVGIGALAGPGDFLAELRGRDWAVDACGDLARWFAASTEAQAAARHEISAQIHEALFDLGELEWKEPAMEDEDADPVGPTDPRSRFAELAVAAGLIRPGDRLDQNVVDLCRAVAEDCARIADRYGDGEAGNAGEHIRATFLE